MTDTDTAPAPRTEWVVFLRYANRGGTIYPWTADATDAEDAKAQVIARASACGLRPIVEAVGQQRP